MRATGTVKVNSYFLFGVPQNSFFPSCISSLLPLSSLGVLGFLVCFGRWVWSELGSYGEKTWMATTCSHLPGTYMSSLVQTCISSLHINVCLCFCVRILIRVCLNRLVADVGFSQKG